ncbi:sorting nexin-13-like [Dendronephthya gigantea]|uniref:sorting nexin-13-like n=1 Tax=Dendronephthya gigantea TaxID=151771 RepID=UPI00106AD3A3|nr:sorting nexin-13-like [Dendronephthya gigantea]
MRNDNDMSIWIIGWVGLITILTIGTFGLWWSFLIVLNCIFCLAGFGAVLWYVGSRTAKRFLARSLKGNLGLPKTGLPSLIKKVEQEQFRSYKMDKRLTGASIIDEPLQEVIEYFFRDYIRYWYDEVSQHEEFPYDLRQTLQKVLIALFSRSKDVEWMPFLTVRLVDDFAAHLKLFKLAVEHCDKQKEEENQMESVFFQKEHEMLQAMCRGDICLNQEEEKEYLRTVSDILLYILLPPEDFHNKPFRFLLREVIACNVLLPTVEMVCDPDYINQTIVIWCQENSFNVEAFLSIIRSSDSVSDVEEIKARVRDEITKLRSHDSESTGDAIMTIRQQLSSMLFVMKICEARIKSLKTGDDDTSVLHQEGPDMPNRFLPVNQNLPVLPLQDILDNNTALSYFIEFIGWVGGQEILFFWLAIESFRVTAEQQLSIHAEKELRDQAAGHRDTLRFSDVESVREAALSIYDQYLSPTATPQVELDEKLVKQTLSKIKNQPPSADFFDALQKQSFNKLEQQNIYGSFLKSQIYMKCLIDLGFFKEKSDETESLSGTPSEGSDETHSRPRTDSCSSIDSLNSLWTRDEEIRVTANISRTGLCRNDGKSYGIYEISVYRASSEGTVTWTIARRFSDFDDLHLKLKEKFGSNSLGDLHLPKKNPFRNTDRSFLEKRKQDLDCYLQKLLSPELLDANPGMFEIVSNFLEIGKYVQEKGQFARKVAPIRSSVHNMSHAIKNVPEGITGGLHRVSGGLHRVLAKNKTGSFNQKSGAVDEYSKISANIDNDDDDNIPLRILLLLMDEVFDLKHRNLWLRRRIIIMLKQIIKTTFGDRINRKIVDSVEWMTSFEQLAEYVRLFRDAYWPDGILAEEYPERSESVKLRTRVTAKTMMLGSLPDDLKRFLGSEVSKDGVFRVFNTFQYPELNKRLLYVISEGFLEQLFPEKNFPEIFRKLHTKEHKSVRTTSDP